MLYTYGDVASPGVDGAALTRKLAAHSPGHWMAIIDAVEQFHDLANIHDTRSRLQAVGLLRG